jgi:hypothetical protein
VTRAPTGARLPGTMRDRFLVAMVCLAFVACSGDDDPPGSSNPGSGGSASGGRAGASGGGAGSAGETASGGGPAVGGSGGSAGSGAGGTGGAWPTCNAQPAGAPDKTIAQIWADDPAAATAVWLPGVYVTGVARGACKASNADCGLFVQQAETYASFDEGAKQAIRVQAFGAAVSELVGLAVGDQIDLYGSAWRHASGELYFELSSTTPGCAQKVGTGAPIGIPGVTLEDLTLDAYEKTHGPLLVTLNAVSGKPKEPTQIFPLWKSFQISDGGIEEVVNLSPYYLPNSAFVGLTQDVIVNFTSVQAVFGLFVPEPTRKFKVLYIRTMDDVLVGST